MIQSQGQRHAASCNARDALQAASKKPRGSLTYTQARLKGYIHPVRRSLEKCFPVLLCAENQWAADKFLQEATQSDCKAEALRKKRKEAGEGSESAGLTTHQAGVDAGVNRDQQQALELPHEPEPRKSSNGRKEDARNEGQNGNSQDIVKPRQLSPSRSVKEARKRPGGVKKATHRRKTK